ncbi:MAG TPA: bifunctional 4-hydroxy-2-oxoglutarate aldolase/2-dehydro-3-deoxy-phosphogluconate aldolase [Gemmatimonadales bacterium]
MIDRLTSVGVIAVVRLLETADLRAAARALAAGGVDVIEVTLTTPGALDAIARLSSNAHQSLVGAGTVLDEGSARDVVAAGARFVVSPTLERGVIRVCSDLNVPCIPGALTPTELLDAWRAGAGPALIKLFPASAVGPRYLREVLAPLPFLRVVPSGGVSLENAGEWIRAGAAAVSVGSALVSAELIRDSAWAELTRRARALVDAVAAARAA